MSLPIVIPSIESLTDLPVKGEGMGMNGGCRYVCRWNGDGFHLEFHNITVHAWECEGKEYAEKVWPEVQYAFNASGRAQYLLWLSRYAPRGIATVEDTGPIVSMGETASSVARDIVRWICHVHAKAIQESSIPQEYKDMAESGFVLPPGFSQSSLRPPDSRPGIDLMAQVAKAQAYYEWLDSIKPAAAVHMEYAPAAETVDMYRRFHEELYRTVAGPKSSHGPRVIPASMRLPAQENMDDLPAPPVMEEVSMPAPARPDFSLLPEAERKEAEEKYEAEQEFARQKAEARIINALEESVWERHETNPLSVFLVETEFSPNRDKARMSWEYLRLLLDGKITSEDIERYQQGNFITPEQADVLKKVAADSKPKTACHSARPFP